MKSDTRNRLLAKLHILIAQVGADKEALYSSYGVTSATQMSDYDLIDCIGKLEGNTSQAATRVREWGKNDDVVRKLRSEILSLLTKSPAARDPRKRGLGLPNDWEVLNPWIERHAGKRLNRLTIEELASFKKQLLALRAKGWIWREPQPAPASQQIGALEMLYGMPIIASQTIS